jgi:hypothetical protein
MADPLMDPIRGAEHREVAGVQMDIARAGAGRVKRVLYPAGFRWSSHMKPIIGGDFCTHAHVGFLLRGQVDVKYADGGTASFAAPQALVIDPGHDAWVVGDTPAVLIEFDFEGDTAKTFGLRERKRHA